MTPAAKRYLRARKALEVAREALYAEIRARLAAGESVRDIARDTGLTFQRVQQVGESR
jgi:hypothetical protein